MPDGATGTGVVMNKTQGTCHGYKMTQDELPYMAKLSRG